MARTTIEVDEEVRDKLRRYKSLDGQTYDEAILELLERAPWADPVGGQEPGPAEEWRELREENEERVEELGLSDEALKPEASSSPKALEEVDFPDGRDRAECEAAVRAAVEYIRQEGGASMRELVTEVMPAHPVGYDVPDLEPGDRFRGAWWRKVVKPGLEAVGEIEAPSPGASKWRYVD